jgi:diguanylate cyclase (GGDEF)-like protein/PAS domain S-box-containing protein
MKQALDYGWSFLAKTFVLALAYTLLAKVALSYFSDNGVVSIVWPSSGLALAALLVGGKKYWLGIFIGAFAGNVMQESPLGVSFFIATGSTLGILTCAWLLGRIRSFKVAVTHAHDFLWLSIAGALGASVSAFIGVATLFLAGTLTKQAIAHNLLSWWQGDTLGIILVTSFILVWRQLPHGWSSKNRLGEAIVCFGLAFLVGQIVFLGWFNHYFGAAAKNYWMFLFVTWAAVRFGRHGALLVISMVVMQMLLGLILLSGESSAGQMTDGLLNFWLYAFVITLTGLFLAVITDKSRTTEVALRQSRDLFNKIAQRVPGVIYQFKLFPDGRSCFPFATEAMQDIYEVEPEDVAQDASIAFARLHPDDHDGIFDSIQESARTLDIWKYEFRVVLPNQGIRWRLGESQPERLEDGSILWHGFITDITDRKNAEERINRLTKLYKAQNEINQAIVHMEEQDELFPLVCRCAVEFGGMKLAWVGQLENSSKLIQPVASQGDWKGRLDDLCVSTDIEVLTGRSATGTAMRENEAIIINDFLNNPMTEPWRSNAEMLGWASVAAFPIQRGGLPFAVLTVCHEEVNAFGKDIIKLLEEMAVDVSFALDNFDRETQRKEADESLRLAASVYEASSESIMITNAQNLIVAVNPAFTRTTGYLAEEVIGENPRILKSGHHDEEFYKEMWSEIQANGHWHGEVWDRRKNGEIYPKWLVINVIFDDDGNVQQHVAMFTDISQKREAEELIWQQANFDFLTKLPNRQMFHDRLEQGIKKSHRTKQPLALMLLDLDRFKEVNDTLGHDQGDSLLVEASQRLLSCVRETDTVARLGGDEFIVILESLNDPTNVERVAQDILQKLRQPFHLGNEIAYVSASIGITVFPTDATEIEVLIKNADQAMYSAKSDGRNRCSYFTSSMQWASQVKVQIANDLHDAIAEGQFWVAYQPIVELKSGNIQKAEALIRWQHPERGLISPGEFIPVAEDTGLINDIGEWVFHEAAIQASLWRKSIHPEFQVSINKSPVQFRNISSTSVSWPDQLQQLNLPGQSVVVEITEGMLMDATDTINNKLLKFRDAGIQVSLDDFGTGYSSLSYLKKFDIDYLKIDQSFTRNLKPSSDDLALCEAIIVMAHKLGMKVIAEGIETIEQRDLLIAAGCDYGQGYFFSKPVAASEFESLIIKDRLAG